MNRPGHYAPLACAIEFAIAASGCAHAPAGSGGARGTRGTDAPVADSVTIALWHLDETGGTRAADAGPARLDARAGADTRTDFGRYRGARIFTRSIDSFLYVPFSPVLQSPRGITIEAWVWINEYGQYEDTPIAGRWTQQANEQSWLFSVVGQDILPPFASLPSPGFHQGLIQTGALGELMFVFQPDEASGPRAYFSSRPVERQKWTRVAASYDGSVVRFYIDGLLDAQYATRGTIRESSAPLLVGNYFDPRWLTDFGGDLRVGPIYDGNPYYAFDGYLDELRISSEARTRFEGP